LLNLNSTKMKNTRTSEQELPPAPVVLGTIGMVLGVANFVNGTVRGELTKDTLKEIKSRLDKIEQDIQVLVQLTQLVIAEIHWSSAQYEISEALVNIDFQEKRMNDFQKDSFESADAWAKEVLDEGRGLARDLFILNRAMLGDGINNPPIMEVYIDKLRNSSILQSVNYDARTYFQRLIDAQVKGMIVLAEAFVYQNNIPAAEIEPRVTEFIKEYDKWIRHQKFNAEFWISEQNANPWYYNTKWGENVPQNYFLAPYVQTEDIVPDFDRQIITSITFVQHNYGKVALKVDLGIFQADGRISPAGDKEMSPDGQQYFPVEDNPYVDSNVIELPRDYVCTGIGIYKKMNRMALKLRGAYVARGVENGNNILILNPATNEWFDKTANDGNYFEVDPEYNYVNANPVSPKPVSYITGAALFQFGNRIGIKVKTMYMNPIV